VEGEDPAWVKHGVLRKRHRALTPAEVHQWENGKKKHGSRQVLRGEKVTGREDVGRAKFRNSCEGSAVQFNKKRKQEGGKEKAVETVRGGEA